MPILSGMGAQMRSPSMRTSPLVATINPARICSSVDLPQPLGPTNVTNCPFLDRERDVGKRAHPRAPSAEILSELADFDDRHQAAEALA